MPYQLKNSLLYSPAKTLKDLKNIALNMLISIMQNSKKKSEKKYAQSQKKKKSSQKPSIQLIPIKILSLPKK
jgi:hypothetical protein